MPEGYTHIRTARLAAKTAGLTRLSAAAFCAGANGPDEFFYYQIWRSADRREPDLFPLAVRMHREKTGAFLLSLIEHAQTPAQRSYVLGFISHYITDCTMHPYVAMITSKGQLYGIPGGHAHFEIALDSELHRHDTGSAAVPANHSAPRFTGSALAQVAQLLQLCLREVYGEEISLEAIADAFHHIHTLRSLSISRTGLKKKLAKLMEPAFGTPGILSGHITPATLKGSRTSDLCYLPELWRNPFTGQVCEIGVTGLLNEAVRKTVPCYLTCRSFWAGRASREQLAALLGSRNYETGLEDAASCAGKLLEAGRP